jgi:hypothetical protein
MLALTSKRRSRTEPRPGYKYAVELIETAFQGEENFNVDRT